MHEIYMGGAAAINKWSQISFHNQVGIGGLFKQVVSMYMLKIRLRVSVNLELVSNVLSPKMYSCKLKLASKC